MRKLALLAAAAAVIAASCTSTGPRAGPPSPSPAPTGPQHFTVAVDATPQTATLNGTPVNVPLAADLFFPAQLSVHPGDVVTFDGQGPGEVHTVTFGTLIDQAIAAAGSPSPAPSGPAPAAGPSLPSVFPPGFPGGRGDAVPSAAQPCFLDTGAPPLAGPCPPTTQPPLTGTQSFYNSGWLPPGSTFTVTVSAVTSPGTYHFEDLAHPAMTGALTVVPTRQPIPGPAQVTASGSAELAAAAQAQAAAAEEAATAGNTIAGITEAGVTGTVVITFGPPSVTVPVGSTITWNVYGEQDLAIDPPPGAQGLLTRAANGSVHLNTVMVNHAGGTAPPAGTPSRPVDVNGGVYYGSGFRNSGLLLSYPPGLLSYSLRFARVGSYTMQSLMYPTMTETVNVTP
jgi:plastocyanin